MLLGDTHVLGESLGWVLPIVSRTRLEGSLKVLVCGMPHKCIIVSFSSLYVESHQSHFICTSFLLSPQKNISKRASATDRQSHCDCFRVAYHPYRYFENFCGCMSLPSSDTTISCLKHPEFFHIFVACTFVGSTRTIFLPDVQTSCNEDHDFSFLLNDVLFSFQYQFLYSLLGFPDYFSIPVTSVSICSHACVFYDLSDRQFNGLFPVTATISGPPSFLWRVLEDVQILHMAYAQHFQGKEEACDETYICEHLVYG